MASRLWDVHTLTAAYEWDSSGGYEDRDNVVEVGGCRNYCMARVSFFFVSCCVRGGFVFVLLAGGPWQVFAGALSWVVLVMVWAALRCDDVQSILSHRTSSHELWLEGGHG